MPIFAAKYHSMEHRIMNIVPSEDGNVCILLYGDIGTWGSVRPDDIVQEMMTADVQGRSIDLRINSVGGEVYAALAIFNAIRASKADITIYIDCLAASAASFIAASGRRVMIASNGRLMIHSVRGYADGTAQQLHDQAREMERLEEILCGIYAQRTGLSAEQIREQYFDGRDHWLSAQEALRLGFVDDIFDAPEPLDAPQDATPQQLCDAYTQRYINSLQAQTSNNSIMFNTLRTRPRFAQCADVEAALNQVAALEEQAAEAEALREERDRLQAECARLQSENEAFQRQQHEQHEAHLQALAEAYVREGRITAQQQENALSMLRADEDTARAYFDSLQAKLRVVDTLHASATSDKDPLEERKQQVREALRR